MKRALITGITGQDGSYMAEWLLAQGYDVHGIVRRVALEDPSHRLARIEAILDRLHLHTGALGSYQSLLSIIAEVQPDECYHFAAQSFVSYSFEDECETINTNISGTHLLLACLKQVAPRCRFYFAGSSELFGNVHESPQHEGTPFHPRSAYGISKIAGYYLTRSYRENAGLHASTGILFNHESPRRGYEFVTRKITATAAKIKLGKADTLRLGNLDARRDWGHSREYVKVMHLMLQQDEPDDYVIASGETHTVREFLEAAFGYLDLDPYRYVVIDPALVRPTEPMVLQGDCRKVRARLGWTYSLPFDALVREMVEHDLAVESHVPTMPSERLTDSEAT